MVGSPIGCVVFLCSEARLDRKGHGRRDIHVSCGMGGHGESNPRVNPFPSKSSLLVHTQIQHLYIRKCKHEPRRPQDRDKDPSFGQRR